MAVHDSIVDRLEDRESRAGRKPIDCFLQNRPRLRGRALKRPPLRDDHDRGSRQRVDQHRIRGASSRRHIRSRLPSGRHGDGEVSTVVGQSARHGPGRTVNESHVALISDHRSISETSCTRPENTQFVDHSGPKTTARTWYALPLAKKCVMTAWAEACPFSVRVWIASKTENPEFVAYAPRTVVSIPSACASVPS